MRGEQNAWIAPSFTHKHTQPYIIEYTECQMTIFRMYMPQYFATPRLVPNVRNDVRLVAKTKSV